MFRSDRARFPGLFLLLLLAPLLSGQERREPRSEIVDGDPMVTLGPVGMIPEINDPVFVDADVAGDWMAAEELVIGVIDASGRARAYSTWHLDHHEIVNDRLGETPIAATW